MSCNFTEISTDINENCDVIIPGKEDLMYAIPLDWIDKAACVFNTSNPMILEDLILKTPASPLDYKAFKIIGKRGSNYAGSVLAKGKYSVGRTHDTSFFIFDNDPIAKKLVAEYSNTTFVIVAKTKYNNRTKAGTPSDCLYEVYGWDNGMDISEETNTNADANGGWFLKAATPEGAIEGLPPLTFFKTSAAATEAAVLALL
jgi:hypothetical protein